MFPIMCKPKEICILFKVTVPFIWSLLGKPKSFGETLIFNDFFNQCQQVMEMLW